MTVFADDMALYCPAPTAAELRNKLNVDLQNMTRWLSTHKLTLNVEKSKLMIIGNNQRLKKFTDVHLMVGGKQLGRVPTFKYLGIIINQTLTWHEHIYAVQAKINQRLGILKRLKHLLPPHIRKICNFNDPTNTRIC